MREALRALTMRLGAQGLRLSGADGRSASVFETVKSEQLLKEGFRDEWLHNRASNPWKWNLFSFLRTGERKF